LAAAAAAALVYAIVTIYWRDSGDGAERRPEAFRNPFSLGPVVGFAVLLAAAIMTGRAIADWFGAGGAALGAVILGFADVDSVTVAVARLVPGSLDRLGGAQAILAAVAANTATKAVIAGA